ncbi:hypothetical protein GF376_04400 [Candidatus Peregrinibacteria bacterium]|nr:hypothetical protein [Candidatus Peregrinibacteria bacterium]
MLIIITHATNPFYKWSDHNKEVTLAWAKKHNCNEPIVVLAKEVTQDCTELDLEGIYYNTVKAFHQGVGIDLDARLPDLELNIGSRVVLNVHNLLAIPLAMKLMVKGFSVYTMKHSRNGNHADLVGFRRVINSL